MMILRQFLCDHLVQICVMMPMLLRATYKDFKGAQSPHLGELLLLYSPQASYTSCYARIPLHCNLHDTPVALPSS